MMKAIDCRGNNDHKEVDAKQMEQLKSDHLNEIKQILEDTESTKKRLNEQIELLTEGNHKL